MTNSVLERRKQRFAAGSSQHQKPSGLISRGSKALTERQISELVAKLSSEPASSRPWLEIRSLRESTLKSELRPQVLKIAIETCIAQNRVELESSTRALLELPLDADDKAKYQKIRVIALINSGNMNEAFELNTLVDFVAGFVQNDLYLCGSLAVREKEPMIRQLMQASIKKIARHAIDAVNRGLRPLSRPEAINSIQEFTRVWVN